MIKFLNLEDQNLLVLQLVQNFLWKGFQAVSFALIAILIYIWLSFEWQFGFGAVVALTHDVLFTLGVLSIFNIEFSLSTIAAILTIAGYSINDTVVIFDRVRENLRKYKRLELLTCLICQLTILYLEQ